MPVIPPSHEDLVRIAGRYGLPVEEDDLASYAGMIAEMLGSYDTVQRLYEQRLPDPPRRAWQRPDPAANPLGAWYVTTSITADGEAGPADSWGTGPAAEPGAAAGSPASDGSSAASDVAAGPRAAGRPEASAAGRHAAGQLAGRTVAVKDSISVAGVPMMNGSAIVDGFVPRRDATVVTRLLAAGATITGKAVCEDLCFSGGSHTSRTGPVRNPWDLSRSAGGSSSGSAALVAAGAVGLALGGDQAGSIRIPASFCGVVGHKPTHGLVPYTGAFPIENTIDHLGPITRTVRDAAVMLTVLAGPDGLDHRQGAAEPQDYLAGLDDGVRGLRVAVIEEGFGIPGLSQPEVDQAVRAAIGVLAEAGAIVAPVSIPWHRDGAVVADVIGTDGVVNQLIEGFGHGMNTRGRYDPELTAHFARGLRERPAELPPTVAVTMFCGRYMIDAYDSVHYAMARNLALELTAAYDEALREADVLVLPTLPIVASPIPPADASLEESVLRSTEMIANTAQFDVTGHPAISVPAGLARVPGGPAHGLPAGLMIVARRYDDATCLRAARAYEAAVGGFPAPPAHS
jgi:amidase